MFARLDPSVEPTVFRGATVREIELELEALRSIEHVVRGGHVRRIGTTRIELAEGSIASDPGQLFVDCTAAGVPDAPARPIFEADRITMQYVTPGFASWSAANIGTVEALREDDAEKNRLCPAAEPANDLSRIHRYLRASMGGLAARAAEPDLAAWNEECRLNLARGAMDRLDDPRVAEALTSLITNVGPALENLARFNGSRGT